MLALSFPCRRKLPERKGRSLYATASRARQSCQTLQAQDPWATMLASFRSASSPVRLLLSILDTILTPPCRTSENTGHKYVNRLNVTVNRGMDPGKAAPSSVGNERSIWSPKSRMRCDWNKVQANSSYGKLACMTSTLVLTSVAPCPTN